LTTESQVSAERAVNVVGAEAQLVAAARAVGLTSESQVAAERAVNVVCAEAKLHRKHPSLASPVAWTWPSDDIFSLFQAD
jgi:hypothetical protein